MAFPEDFETSSRQGECFYRQPQRLATTDESYIKFGLVRSQAISSCKWSFFVDSLKNTGCNESECSHRSDSKSYTPVVVSTVDNITREVTTEVHFEDKYGRRTNDPSHPPAPHHSSLRENKGGNFCCHDPKNIRIYVEGVSKRLPKILQDAIDFLRDWMKNPKQKRFAVLNGVLTRGTNLQYPRSEGRESYGNTLINCIAHMNLETLCIGTPSERGFFTYTVKKLAEFTELSMSRFKTAYEFLKNLGILSTEKQERIWVGTPEKGKWKCFPNVKKVSSGLFKLLGIELEKLEEEREKAKKRRAAELEKKPLMYSTNYAAMYGCPIPTPADEEDVEEPIHIPTKEEILGIIPGEPIEQPSIDDLKQKAAREKKNRLKNMSKGALHAKAVAICLKTEGMNPRDPEDVQNVVARLKNGETFDI